VCVCGGGQHNFSCTATQAGLATLMVNTRLQFLSDMLVCSMMQLCMLRSMEQLQAKHRTGLCTIIQRAACSLQLTIGCWFAGVLCRLARCSAAPARATWS
jgi:hypothetical protein